MLEKGTSGNLVATDSSDGEFFQASDGSVEYRHPSDPKAWLVAKSISAFHSAVESFRNYNSEVIAVSSEEEELKCVQRFRERLLEAQVPIEGKDSYWKVILDQCESGHL